MGRIVLNNDLMYARLGIDPTEATPNETALINAAVTQAEGLVRQYLGYDPVYATRTQPVRLRDHRGMGGSFGGWDVTDTHAVFRVSSSASGYCLQLQHIPIREIVSLKVDYNARHGAASNAFSGDPKELGVDFWPQNDGIDDNGNYFCKSGLLLSDGLFPAESGNVLVEYTAGYLPEEFAGISTILDASPIVSYVTIEASRRAKEAFLTSRNERSGFTAGEITAERLGDYSYQTGGTTGSTTSTSTTFFGGMNELLPETKRALSGFVNFGWMLNP